MSLHNRVNREEMRQHLLADPTPRTTLSFYRYLRIADPQAFRDALYARLQPLGVFGRIHIAQEGINAQASVPAENLEQLRATLKETPGLQGLRLNIAVDDDGKSFWVLKIVVREKIVADGIDDPAFDISQSGTHLDAASFNALAESGEAIVVDMRNHYEYEVGHFDGAVEIPSDTFRAQLPMAVEMLEDVKDKPVVMYCTGGIRCEKASAYLRHQGFSQVYQLDGGIIEYTRSAREQGLPNLFRGKNFVFDGRMAERISADVLAQCHTCDLPCDDHVNCALHECHQLIIQCAACAERLGGCCCERCQEIARLPKTGRAAAFSPDGSIKHFSKSASRE